MAALTPASPGRATGADLTAAGCVSAGAAGDTFAPGNDTYLFVRSTNSGSVTITVDFASGEGPSGTSITDYALAPALSNGNERLFGPFPASPFAQAADGQVHVVYSSASNVSVKVLKMS